MSAATIAAQKKKDARNKKRREREKRKRDEKKTAMQAPKVKNKSKIMFYMTVTATNQVLLVTMEPRGRNKKLSNRRLQSTSMSNPLHPLFVKHPPQDLKGKLMQLLLRFEALASSNLTNLTMISTASLRRNFHANYGFFLLLM